MKVLIGCEFSGVVRRAFSELGHEAWSCDLLPCEDESTHHIQGDLFGTKGEWIHGEWDLAIFHPPCTHLAVSGARWFKDKHEEQRKAIWFFLACYNAPVERVAVENPVSIMSRLLRKPDQIIQPWQFGHGETKATCLWLRGLPKLNPTNIVQGRETRVHRMPPGPNRWKERSRTFHGIAKAMAEQWGNV